MARKIAGRFEIEEQAGQGGAGTVFRARDTESGERVAVKVLRAIDDAVDARFAREARILSQLRHPSLVRYVAHGVPVAGDPYLVMEWLDGEDLGARLQRGKLEVHEAVALGRRVAEALSVVHAAGLVHRDVKPGNIFLCNGSVEQVKVIDFGLARSAASSNQLTLTGMVVGTPAYMAPEQARGDREIGARADLFALGCVLFKCLTGHAPFEGSHAVEVMTKVILDDPPAITDLRPAVPNEVAAVVHHLLEKDPEQRPRSATEVAALLGELEAELAGEATLKVHASPAPRLSLTSEERRVVSVLLIAAGEDAARSPMIEPLVREHGGRLARLSDGTRVVMLEGAAAATDQAVSAARCALSLRAVLPGTPMALVTGHTEIAGRMPAGGMIERAAEMLARSIAAAVDAAQERRPPPSWIAIDEDTAPLVEARFEVRRSGGMLALLGTREVTLGARTLLGKPTAMVGRDWELSSIGQLFSECVETPAASAVVVTGAAGMGKSRLAHELLGIFRAIDPTVEIWIGSGEATRARSALGLLGQALRGAAGIREGEPLEVQRRKVAERVARHAAPADAARWTEFLAELVGVGSTEDASPALTAARADPPLMAEQMNRAWEGLLAAECAAHPLILVLEDLQWGDLSTVRFVDAALGALEHRPWMVLALGRPELHQLFPGLFQRRNVQMFRLNPLTTRASVSLVRQVLGDATDTKTCDRVAAQAAGNAFYLEELIRSVAQGEAEEGALPETVLAMVQARLAGLDTEARRILRAASVFGDVLWPGGVAALLGEATAWSLGPWLEALTAQEILVRRASSRFEGEPELVFRHALLREGAYAMLTDEDRTLGHRLAGEWLEQRGEHEAALLAEHFERGGQPDRAGAFYTRAAQQALWGNDTDAAMAMARRGLDVGVPDDMRMLLLALLCEAHSWRDDWDTAARYGEETIAISPPGSAPWATARRAQLGEAMRRGNIELFLEIVRTLESADPSPEAASAVVLALATAVFILDWNCRFADATARHDRMVAIVEGAASSNLMARGWLHMTRSTRRTLALGEPWAGLAWGEAALATFEEANHSRGMLLARFALGGNAWSLGMHDRAKYELTATMVADEEFALGSVLRELYLAHVLSEQGEIEEAKKVPRRLIERSRARNTPRYEGQARLALAEIFLRAGELGDAETEVHAAMALPQLMPLDRMHGTALRAAVLLAQGRVEEALATAEQAMAVYLKHEVLGPRHAFARLVHAEALHANGNVERARVMIGAARDLLLTRAANIEDAGMRASFLERVPENARTLALAEAWRA
ncbi:Adenylate cyclase [Minicystis rosea]|nr:Adenylate cyclase [Minicystis rosea]